MTTEEKLAHLRKYYPTDEKLYFALKKHSQMLKIEALKAENISMFLAHSIEREYARVTSLRGK